ncbi:hypothetical protein D3C71_1258540 [compost metagenome]
MDSTNSRLANPRKPTKAFCARSFASKAVVLSCPAIAIALGSKLPTPTTTLRQPSSRVLAVASDTAFSFSFNPSAVSAIQNVALNIWFCAGPGRVSMPLNISARAFLPASFAALSYSWRICWVSNS